MAGAGEGLESACVMSPRAPGLRELRKQWMNRVFFQKLLKASI